MNLSEMEEDMLAEAGNIGAGHASRALSDLVDKEVEVTVPSASLVDVADLPKESVETEEFVVCIYVPVSGDVDGGVLLIFPKKDALQLSDVLMGQEVGTSSKLNEMGESSLKEVGNILVGNCLTALSRFLELNLEEHVPEIADGPLEAILDTLASSFAEKTGKALEINEKMEINNGERERSIEFFLLFGQEDAKLIVNSVKQKVRN